MSEKAESFDEMSEHLAERYNAEHILYATRSESGEVLLSYWSVEGSWMGTLSAGDGIDTSNYTNQRAAVLDGFWSTYQNVHASSSAGNSENAGLTRYRLVGRPSGAVGT
ncbi:hypothetical protein [Roseivivax sp. CAU 1761]